MPKHRPLTSTHRGLAFLAICACIVAVVGTLWRSSTGGVADVSEAERRELQQFDAQQRVAEAQRDHQTLGEARGDAPIQLFPFDPNTVDSATFVRLGLKPWQARNALRYRQHGGRWRSADHFSRLYGLSTEHFQRLRPYIRISPVAPVAPDAPRRDTLARRNPEKLPAGAVVDLNTADTTLLRRIPGIGPYRARRICALRQQLGAFVSPSQLSLVPDLPEGIEVWFTIENGRGEVRRTNLNRATFQELVRHPYLDYEQVKALFDYRRKHGAPLSWHDLSLLPAFAGVDTTLMSIYLEF